MKSPLLDLLLCTDDLKTSLNFQKKCGMVAGLVSDIPTVQELIDRIMSEAEDIIASKLQKAI